MHFSGAKSNPPERGRPSLADLFITFTGIAIIGFGGVPWGAADARRAARWLTADEFTEVLSPRS